MSLLKSLKTDESAGEVGGERDSLGGAKVYESGLYPATVALAYLKSAASEALSLVAHFKMEDGSELRQTFWMTSGKEKGKKTYYEKDGKKNYLPGFLQANALALLSAGQEIADLDTEEKVIKLYSKEAGAEVPTKVQVVSDLMGKEILLGVLKQTVDKTAKVGDTNEYVPTGDTRDENEVDKMFRASDRKTVTEIRAQADAAFVDEWEKKWKGQTKNKARGASGTAGAPGGAAAKAGAPGSTKPSKSLFG